MLVKNKNQKNICWEKRGDANKIMGILREQAVLGLRGGDFGGLPLGD